MISKKWTQTTSFKLQASKSWSTSDMKTTMNNFSSIPAQEIVLEVHKDHEVNVVKRFAELWSIYCYLTVENKKNYRRISYDNKQGRMEKILWKITFFSSNCKLWAFICQLHSIIAFRLLKFFGSLSLKLKKACNLTVFWLRWFNSSWSDW